MRGYLGACGSGKTYALQACARHAVTSTAWRVLVLDVNGEWPDATVWRGSGVRPVIVDDATRAAEHLSRGARLVVYRPRHEGIDWRAPNPYASAADEAARVAIDGPPTILVLPEVHWSAREGYPLPSQLGRIAHQWRHVGALAWLDTQNPADVRKELFRALPDLWVFRPGGWQDFATLRAIGGPELERAARGLSTLVEREQRAGRESRGWHLRVRVGDNAHHTHALRIDGSRVVRAPLPSAR